MASKAITQAILTILSTMSDKDAKKIFTGLTKGSNSQMYSTPDKEQVNAIKETAKDVAMGDPKDYLIDTAAAAASNGLTAASNISDNDAKYLAQAAIANLMQPTEAQRNLFGNDINSNAAQLAAANIARKYSNLSAGFEAAANAVDDVYGNYRHNRDLAKQMEVNAVQPMSSGAWNYANGNARRQERAASRFNRGNK